MRNLIGSVCVLVCFIAIILWQHEQIEAKENEKLEEAIALLNNAYSYERGIEILNAHVNYSKTQREFVLSKLIPALRVREVDSIIITEFFNEESKLLKKLNAHSELSHELIYGDQDKAHTIALLFCITHFDIAMLLNKEEQTDLYGYLHKITWDHSQFEQEPIIRQIQISACANMVRLTDVTEEEIEKLRTSHPNPTICGNAAYYTK